MNLIFLPVRHIFNHLSIIKKFSLMFVLYLIPIIYITYFVISGHTKSINQTNLEAEGIEIIHSLTPLIINTAKARGLTNSYLNGNQALRGQLDNIHNQLSSYWNQAADNIQKLQDEEITALFVSSRKLWQELPDFKTASSADNIFEDHSHVIAKLLKIIIYIGEKAQLITDPDLDNALIIKVYSSELPSLIENIGKTRGQGAGILARKKFFPAQYIKLSNNINAIKKSLSDINHYLRSASNISGVNTNLIETFRENNKYFLALTNKNLVKTDSLTFSSSEYFRQGTKAIKSSIELLDNLHIVLTTKIQQRLSALNNDIMLNIISTIALLIGAMYFFFAFFYNIKNSIQQIQTLLAKITQGDLTEEIQLESQDEMKLIAADINKMIVAFRELVGRVLASSNKVLLSAKENATVSEAARENISQQNNEIEQVATAMNEMSTNVHDVAKNAKNTAEATSNADTESNNGKQIVTKSIASIQRLSKELESSTHTIEALQKHALSIGSVLDVIQSIANQTNLLALNAAIEAARAGESGRGFAVVADEVRTLAGKTQVSTEEIRKMIDTLQQAAKKATTSMNSGNEQSQLTVVQANQAGDALIKIAEAIDQISQMSEQIANAAVEQSVVAEEINKNVVNLKNLSDITHDNAMESADNSENLLLIAEELKTQVSTFKIS